MSNLNILIIRYRNKNLGDNAAWYFHVDPQDQPILFHTQQAAWERANELNAEAGDNGFEYVPNVLTASMSVAEMDGNEAQVARLTDNDRILRVQLDTARASLDAEKQRHQEDITRIGEKLIEEANDRGWCRDYDTIVDDINRHLHVELPVRMKDYDITYEVTIHVTRTCEGRDGDDAYQRDPGPSASDIIQVVRDGNYDLNEWTVEESDG